MTRSAIFEAAVAQYHSVRTAFEDYREERHASASHDCNGVLLNAVGRAAGVSSYELFIGAQSTAEKYASPELIEWWNTHGRMTFADFERQSFQGLEATG